MEIIEERESSVLVEEWVLPLKYRAVYWLSAAAVYVIALAMSPSVGILATPYESGGVLFGIWLIWYAFSGRARRRWGTKAKREYKDWR